MRKYTIIARLEKVERLTMYALKEQNLEEYSAFVQKTKNKKIMEILSTTETFQKQIAYRVRSQNGEVFDEEEDSETRRERADDTDDFNVQFSTLDSNYYNRIYYDLTHSNKEEVREQPLLLEGGQLKSYQLAGLSWMVSLYNNRLNGILADEMGLGKTIQTLVVLSYDIQEREIEFKKKMDPLFQKIPSFFTANFSLFTAPNFFVHFYGHQWSCHYPLYPLKHVQKSCL